MANPLIAPRRPHASPIRRAGRVEEGIWSQPPTRAVAPLSGRLDEPVTLTELAVAHALSRPCPCTRRTQTNGTRSNPGTAPTTPPVLAEHPPDDPDADEIRDRTARQ